MFQLTPPNAPSRSSHSMRAACPHCGHGKGYIEIKNGQRCVYCSRCGRFAYNAPKKASDDSK
jgi:uncharacterized protein (DUF983 family)